MYVTIPFYMPKPGELEVSFPNASHVKDNSEHFFSLRLLFGVLL